MDFGLAEVNDQVDVHCLFADMKTARGNRMLPLFVSRTGEHQESQNPIEQSI